MLFSVFITYAQDSIPAAEDAPKKKFSFSGSADAYYRTNLGAPNGGDNHQTPNTSFANGNGFALGIHLIRVTARSSVFDFARLDFVLPTKPFHHQGNRFSAHLLVVCLAEHPSSCVRLKRSGGRRGSWICFSECTALASLDHNDALLLSTGQRRSKHPQSRGPPCTSRSSFRRKYFLPSFP